MDRALTEERTLLVSWLNRGTLHLVRREDYPWLHALTAPRLMRGNARRLAEEGVSAGTADRAVRIIERALIRDGALTRAQLSHEIDAGGVKLQGQGMVHVLLLASLQGLIVRGPVSWIASRLSCSCATGSARRRRWTATGLWRSSRDATWPARPRAGPGSRPLVGSVAARRKGGARGDRG